MEIRARHCSIVINCVIFIPYLLAKPFSLNEAIAEEVRRKHSLNATSGSQSASIRQQEFTLPVFSSKIKQSKNRVHTIPDNKISPLQYKRTYKIRAPLKPKRLKRQPKLRNKIKIKPTNRQINSDEIFNSKYIPLLKSLSMLFDNILNTDTSESYEAEYENEQIHYDSDDNGSRCSCTYTQNEPATNIRTHETTVAPLTTFTSKIPGDIETDVSAEATTTPTHNTALSNVRPFQRNKNLSILLTRNTSSGGRDNNGFREGSGTTNYGSSEGDFAGDYGDNERHTGNAKHATDSQHNEEHPDSNTRDYASSNEFFRRISGDHKRNAHYRRTDKDQIFATESPRKEPGRYNNISEGQNKFKTRGHETESTILLPNLDSGLRRYTVEVQANETEPVTHEKSEENNFNVTFDSTGYKRFFSGDGSNTTENKEVCRTDETVKVKYEASEPMKSKVPVVTIIDGYSIARDVNGENKLTEKAIHIHT